MPSIPLTYVLEKNLTSGMTNASAAVWTALRALGDTGSFHSEKPLQIPNN